MPPAPSVTVVPTSEQRRAFRRWAGPRGIQPLPGNGFAVPAERLRDVPHELLLGARIGGEIYLPAPGQVRHDAPPLDGPDPLEALLTEHEFTADELDALDESPAEVVSEGVWQPPPADDLPTTGAPDLDDSP